MQLSQLSLNVYSKLLRHTKINATDIFGTADDDEIWIDDKDGDDIKIKPNALHSKFSND